MHNLIAILEHQQKKNENRIPLHPSLFHNPTRSQENLIFEKDMDKDLI